MWKLLKTPRSVNAIVIGAAVVEALDSGMRRGVLKSSRQVAGDHTSAGIR